MNDKSNQPEATQEAPDGSFKSLEIRELTAEENRWYDMLDGMEERSIEVCRDTAKTILQVMGFVIPGFFAGLIAIFSITQTPVPCEMTYPLWFWFGALIFAIIAMIPLRINAEYGADKIKKSFQRIVSIKRWLVILSGTLLVLGMVSLMVFGIGAVN